MYQSWRKMLLLSLMVSLLAVTGALAAGGTGQLTGQFRDGKAPLAEGRFFIFDKAMGPPSAGHYVRVPDHIGMLDNDGRFSLDLPAGTYYVTAIRKPVGILMGPPAEGENLYFARDAKGEIVGLVVAPDKKTDAGIITSSVPYKRKLDAAEAGTTVIEGVVTDADGAPVAGAIVLAYLTPGLQDKASFISDRTGKDGKFVLRFQDGGTYYLRIRGEYGGTPREGEFVNLNDPNEMATVSVKRGEKASGVSFRVRRLQRGPLYKGNVPNPN